ncbi:pyoverdine export/recycling transporter periplasmic adaptor subunit PvdR [soil metagenome]
MRLRPIAIGLTALAAIVGAAFTIRWIGTPTIGYRTTTIDRANVEATVTAIGALHPRRFVDVGAQVSGQINRLHPQPGAEVRKGDLLVEIDPSVAQATVDAGRASLAGLRAQLADQQAQHRLAGQQLARQRQMSDDGAKRAEDVQTAEANLASAAARIAHLEAQIQQTQAALKADEARLGYTRIYASMSGTVVSVEAREGQTLNATYQTPNILRIADLSTMTVWTEVSEADVRRVRPGMPAHFSTLGGPGDETPRRWSSTVRQVLPAPPVAAGATSAAGAVPAAATKAVVYTVLFDVDNSDGELMPQMTAQVAVVTSKADGVVAAPLSALTAEQSARSMQGDKVESKAAGDAGNTYTARVLGADGKPETRQVRIGVRSRHQAEVRDGLAVGDRLVVGEVVGKDRLRWFQW